jgi:hypothetical protein
VVIDFDPVNVNSVRHRAGRIHDFERRAAEPMRDPADNEFEAALGEHHVVNGCRGNRYCEEHQERGGDEQQASHRLGACLSHARRHEGAPGEQIFCDRFARIAGTM